MPATGADAIAREDCRADVASISKQLMISKHHSYTHDGADGCLEVRFGEQDECEQKVGDIA